MRLDRWFQPPVQPAVGTLPEFGWPVVGAVWIEGEHAIRGAKELIHGHHTCDDVSHAFDIEIIVVERGNREDWARRDGCDYMLKIERHGVRRGELVFDSGHVP